MRSTFYLVGAVLIVLGSGCKSTQRATDSRRAPAYTIQKVKAACAKCVFGMKGVVGCKLAVKIDGRDYLVTGSGINDHGDAHAHDGLCHVARAAEVQGTIEDNRFVASLFRLQP